MKMNDVRKMLEYEKQRLLEGFSLIGGVDEVGRGPLAGPVVTACVIMPLDDESLIEGVNDSKKLTEKTRERLSEEIKKRAIAYKISSVDESVIDEINILNATKRCMTDSISLMPISPECVLIDAVKLDIDVPVFPIIKGDAKSYTIACASILAKVYRDALMKKYAETYPQYGFERNKGYGTAEHIDALKTVGASPIHRRTFIKNLVKDE